MGDDQVGLRRVEVVPVSTIPEGYYQNSVCIIDAYIKYRQSRVGQKSQRVIDALNR
jgi:hypothetical protein